MYARITSAQIALDKIDRFKKIYEESVVPAARKQKGFKGICLMVDPKTGEGISMTFWESEQDALANEKNLYYQRQVAKFIPFYKRQPIREGFEVLFEYGVRH
jgi:heme-degrading monooxygenase HmoA